MNDIKRTPGQWTVNPLGIDLEENLVFAPTLASGERQLVAIVSTGRYAPANRRLIAAVPELLEELSEMQGLLAYLLGPAGRSPSNFRQCASQLLTFHQVVYAEAKACALLAKVKGGAA